MAPLQRDTLLAALQAYRPGPQQQPLEQELGCRSMLSATTREGVHSHTVCFVHDGWHACACAWRVCVGAVQVPDEEKRRRADYVIDTGCSFEDTEQQVGQVLQELKQKKGAAAARLLSAAAAAE